MNYLDVANSRTMFLLCLVPALTIVTVAVLFIRTAWRRGLDGASHYQCGTREKYGKRMV